MTEPGASLVDQELCVSEERDLGKLADRLHRNIVPDVSAAIAVINAMIEEISDKLEVIIRREELCRGGMCAVCTVQLGSHLVTTFFIAERFARGSRDFDAKKVRFSPDKIRRAVKVGLESLSHAYRKLIPLGEGSDEEG